MLMKLIWAGYVTAGVCFVAWLWCEFAEMAREGEPLDIAATMELKEGFQENPLAGLLLILLAVAIWPALFLRAHWPTASTDIKIEPWW